MSSFSTLTHLGGLRFGGADTETFLQAQFSNDLAEQRPGYAQLQAYCNPKGRVIAVGWLLREGEDWLLVLPQDMCETLAKLLRLYVLRAKVTIEPLAEPLIGIRDAAGLPQARIAGLLPEACDPPRALGVAPPPDVPEADTEAWRLEDIRAGIGFLYPTTSQEHLAQSLNLDANGGMSFTKGCFPGQEIIARLRYLGKVKQRMRRAAAACPPPERGTRLEAQGHTAQVIEAAATERGCELLFVAPVAAPEDIWQIENTPLEPMPLPYEIPKDRPRKKV